MNKMMIAILAAMIGVFGANGELEAKHRKKSVDVSVTIHEGFYFNDTWYEAHAPDVCRHDFCPHHAHHPELIAYSYYDDGCYHYYEHHYYEEHYLRPPHRKIICHGHHAPPVHHHVYHHYYQPSSLSYEIGFSTGHFGLSFGETHYGHGRGHGRHKGHRGGRSHSFFGFTFHL